MKFVGKIHSTTYYIVKAHQWGKKKKTNRKKTPSIKTEMNQGLFVCGWVQQNDRKGKDKKEYSLKA